MKKIISILLSILIFSTLIIMSIPVSGATRNITSVGTVSGSCGNLYWEINDEGVFTIVGSGAIEDFITETSHWYEYDANIKKVIIGDGITRIGAHAFDFCYNIESVHLSDTVVSIGDSAFKRCSHLTDINFPDTLKSIEVYAFQGCSSLETLNSKASLSVGKYAFYKCNSLSQVYLPNSREIGSYAFSECYSLNKANFGTGTINAMVFGTNNISVKSVVAGSLKSKAFYNMATLQSINIVNAKYIGDYAMYGCKNIFSINTNAETIGKEAFRKCYTVKTMTLPKAVTIKDKACFELNKLETVKLGKVKNIGKHAFAKCPSLKNITGTSYLNNIGEYAFACDTALSRITVSDKLSKINEGVFSNCKKLTGSIDFSNVTSVGYDAFANCQKLSSKLNFTKVKIIWDDAFIGCKNIKGNTLGKSLTGLGRAAFVGCKKIKSLYFPPSCKYIGDGALSKELISLSVGNDGMSIESLFVENGSCIKIYSDVNSKAYKYAYKNGIDFEIAVKSISTDKKSYSVKKNKTVKIKASIKPKYASYKYISYTSSNKKVATVNSKGKIKGIGKGKCTITLKSKDGSLKTKKVTVTVK